MRRIYRLRDRDRFHQIRREGRSWAEALLVMCVLPNGLAYSRFGFSVSKRIGTAVVRNRIRRRMREAIRLRYASIASGWDVVFIARASSAEATYQQLAQACERALQRARILESIAPSPQLVGHQLRDIQGAPNQEKDRL